MMHPLQFNNRVALSSCNRPFFNVLNEVLAYQHLHERGFSVCLLQAAHELGTAKVGKRPDLMFTNGVEQLYCEVKTMGASECELDRQEAEEVFSGAVYAELSPGFLNKLSSDIQSAIEQFPQDHPGNIVYVIMNFDDWVGLYYDRYQRQIQEHLASHHDGTQVYCRAGIRERFYVHHVPANAR